MGTRLHLLAAAMCVLAATACSKDESASKKEAALAVARAKAADQARAARVPAELNADGVTVSGSTVALKPALTGTGSELEVIGTLKNASAKPVDGVNLQLTFLDAGGASVGGHNTQQFFQPGVAPGNEQPIVLRVPALGGSVNTAASVKIAVLNRVKQGGSTDGWKPLDPKNMPKPVTVPGSTTRITLDGRVLKEGEPLAPAPASQPQTAALAGG